MRARTSKPNEFNFVDRRFRRELKESALIQNELYHITILEIYK